MMQLKLERDQARTIQQNFIIYLVQLTEMKIRDSTNDYEAVSWQLIRLILIEVQEKLQKKLANKANLLHFNFTDAQGMVLFQIIDLVPVDSMEFYKNNLRSYVKDTLELQMPGD